MAGPPISSGAVATGGGGAVSYRPALALLASLFFMWGFITVLNDILIPHLKAVFDLNYTQSLLIQFVWFIAYGVASFPAAKLIERIRPDLAIVDLGLPVMSGYDLARRVRKNQRLASVRLATPSLRYVFDRWNLTVCSVTHSWRAMRLFV